MVSVINGFFNILFDGLLWPVQMFPHWLQLLWLSLPGAVLALLVFRYTSDQEGIERARDRIKAHLLELRLYRDDLRVSLRAQGSILRHNLTYLRHALVPMAVMIVPFVGMIIQIESRFAYRSLNPGESAILTAQADRSGPVSRLEPELVLPQAIEQETPALRIDETGQILWRLMARAPGVYPIRIRIGKHEVSKRVAVGSAATRVSPAVYRADDPEALAFPAESPLVSDSIIRSIEIDYPTTRKRVFGLSSASWIFCGASLVFGFALRGLFGVTF